MFFCDLVICITNSPLVIKLYVLSHKNAIFLSKIKQCKLDVGWTYFQQHFLNHGLYLLRLPTQFMECWLLI